MEARRGTQRIRVDVRVLAATTGSAGEIRAGRSAKISIFRLT